MAAGTDMSPEEQTDVQNRKNNFEWGGAPGQADADIARYQGKADTFGTSAEGDRRRQSMDYAYQGLSRDDQNKALGLEKSAAEGTAPSQAAELMKTGANNAEAAAVQQASGARGQAGIAQAHNQAAGQQANIMTQNIANTGALRAQEMDRARNAYMQGSTGIRGQDIQNRGQDIQSQGLNMQGQANYEGLGYNTRGAENQAMQNFQNQENDRWKAQMAADANSRDASANNVKTGLASASNAIGALGGLVFSDEKSKDGISDIVGPPKDKTATEKQSDILMKSIIKPSELNFSGNANQGSFHPITVSDEHHKSHIHDFQMGDHPTELDRAFDHMPPKTFEYKWGYSDHPGVRQAGIIAQDAEKHPLTAAMVRDTPKGKGIDVGTATSLNLAANSEHAHRIRALEHEIATLKGGR